MRRILTALLLAVTLTACGGRTAPSTVPPPTSPTTPAATAPTPSIPTPSTPTPTTPTPTTPTTPSAVPALGTVPPAWLGNRPLPLRPDGYGEITPTPPELRDRRFTLPDTVPPLPGTGFASRVTTPAPPDVLARSTWAPGCPVAARDLSWVRLAFWGFDGRRHTGELLVNAAAASRMVQVFRDLYAARFPIEEMRITTKAEQKAHPTGDGNDTGAFNCRVLPGTTTYSQHAYGLAIDVDPFQNPYSKGDVVVPELASAYLDRSRVRPGMILAGGPVVAAFTRIGWGWGGTWHSLKDLQHFSANGR